MPAARRRRTARAVPGAAAALALAAVLAGCGPVTDQTAPTAGASSDASGASAAEAGDLVRQALGNLEDAEAFTVRGSTTDGAIDVAYVRGVGATGTVTSGGSPVTVLATAGKVWVKGDAAWYEGTVGAGSAALIGDKWVELPADVLPSVEVLVDGSALLDSLVDPRGVFERTAVQDLDGVEVVGARDTDSGGTLWVTATGDPLPVRYEERGAVGDQGVLHFADVGVIVPIAPPAPEQVAVVPAPASPPAAPSPEVSRPG